jgi:MoaE-MoaD fusion protein
MAVAIAVRVRLFARLRELAGVETDALQVPPGSSLADVYDALRAKHQALPARDSVRAALNQEFAGWEHRVAEGDEVAFIPPVSGGARCATT